MEPSAQKETQITVDTTIEEIYNQQQAPSALATKLAKRQRFDGSELLPIVTAILCGISFGVCINKSRAFEPYVIFSQMVFEKFIMLKVFLSAAGTSCFSVSLVAYYYSDYFNVIRSERAKCNQNIVRVTVGSFILGIGMSLCGACPGTVTIQLGAGVRSSIFVLIGVLCGTLFYALTDPLTTKYFSTPNFKFVFVDEYCATVSFRWFAIASGVMCWIIVITCEILVPWQSEITVSNAPFCTFLTCGSWPPSISGLFIGLLQIPLILVLGDSLGASGPYSLVIGEWWKCEAATATTETEVQYRPRFWQLLFLFSGLFGSWVAVALNANVSELNIAKYPYDDIVGMSIYRSLMGGFAIIYGARLSNGCPSGHGFSGFMLMTIASLFAICGIFVGGISTAFMFNLLRITI